MANGVPCHWCGFMEATHEILEGWTIDRPMPCADYYPLEPAYMREIEQKKGCKINPLVQCPAELRHGIFIHSAGALCALNTKKAALHTERPSL